MSVEVQVKKSGLKELAKRLQSASVYAGLPKDADGYDDGTNVVEVGIKHEYGVSAPQSYTSTRGNKVSVSGIPERSFMRSTFKEKSGEWVKVTSAVIKKTIKGEISTEGALEIIGGAMIGDITTKINTISTPPNSPQVIADKGSSNPLVDTGHLRQSISYFTEDK